MLRFPLLFVALLSIVLASCAPIVSGSSVSSPLETDFFETSEVRAGQTWYISTYVNPTAMGFSNRELNDLLEFRSVPKVGDVEKASQSSRFRVVDVATPDGWDVDMSRINVVREVNDVDDGFYYFQDSVQVIAAITVPPTASSGMERVLMTLRDRKGEEHIMIFLLEVENDADFALPEGVDS